MKLSIFILLISMAVTTLIAMSLSTYPNGLDSIRKATVVQHGKMQRKNLMTKTVNACPMHPEVLLDKPGKCPKCGMNLVKKTQAEKMEYKRK